MDKWREAISECEKYFGDAENKLSGFTELDEKIKELKKEIKEWMWKSSENSVIFMKAFPVISNNRPLLGNMVRK